ncbi:MAG: peptide deformylase [Candidatus Aegiribacteria sp.]|nr:peptide deformylase [Candidatus Aegiribacteria sp.]
MSSRKLQYYGSSILRNVSRNIDISSEQEFLQSLLMDMVDILKFEKGLGLAAPQAGENVRVFILNPEELQLKGHSVFINPEVTTSEPLQKDEEGCLSIPGVFEYVRRPSSAVIIAYDLSGKQFTLELDDYSARAVQHENDHLNGILFVDRLTPIRKRLVKKQLIEIKREYGPDSRIL